MLCCNAFAKNSLRKSAFSGPLSMAGIMLLFVLGAVTFPTRQIISLFGWEEEWMVLLADGMERIIFCFVMLHFVRSMGFNVIPRKTQFVAYLTVLPALVVAVNNFPFASYFNGDCAVIGWGKEMISFAVWCLGVGVFEEISFRGIIFPLALIIAKNKKWKRPVFWSVVVSSASFSLVHLVNLLNGNVIGTVLQIGYTFLIGSMCGIITAKTGSVIFASLIHVVYNFCGMIVEYCGSGKIWTVGQIILTATVGVVFAAYFILVALRLDKNTAVAENMLGGGWQDYLKED